MFRYPLTLLLVVLLSAGGGSAESVGVEGVEVEGQILPSVTLPFPVEIIESEQTIQEKEAAAAQAQHLEYEGLIAQQSIEQATREMNVSRPHRVVRVKC